ncbi:FadR/GntR family transcriptional regulator [Trujillonella endophytica]|uniref:Transcriptional regulator, GntR family n=1 Tax=Trujillonella endophytica TaxID=673521 RepID=A0A1H8QK20_9ACTN|nr:FadR/GntR family transcriptional regulator [Trujillella endophytica]SEO54559.1 transcriptional regulator, GntR family [Trujillella endophytica]
MSTPGRAREAGASPRPIKRGAKVAEALAQEIVHEIVSRKLPPGTLLSSEAQMLEDYGVGRGSLREALRILEVHGLITMKPGRNGGPMVIEVGSRDYGRMSSLFFHIGGVTFRQLVEARLSLEPMMARLAAERRGQELVGTIVDPETAHVDDDAAYFDATKDFHLTVAAMSGNPVLNLISASLEGIFRDQVNGLLSPADDRRHVLEVHTAIADAISSGDADAAEKLMREHMQEYADWVEQRHPQLVDAIIDWR